MNGDGYITSITSTKSVNNTHSLNISFDIDILYEDNHLLVVKKPRNMLSQADSTGDADILSLLKYYLKEKYQKPGNVFLGLVHRLDRPAGGVMVFARTSKAASRLSEQIRERRFVKIYLAVVHGIPEKVSSRLEAYMSKNRNSNISRISVIEQHALQTVNDQFTFHTDEADEEDREIDNAGKNEGRADTGKNVIAVNASIVNSIAKRAVLDYKTLGSLEKEELSLIEINIHTGRPHQIRLQLSAAGFPIYGDMKYNPAANGMSSEDSNKRQMDNKGTITQYASSVYNANMTVKLALWSYKLCFEHPVNKEQLLFTSLPPDDYPWQLFNNKISAGN